MREVGAGWWVAARVASSGVVGRPVGRWRVRAWWWIRRDASRITTSRITTSRIATSWIAAARIASAWVTASWITWIACAGIASGMNSSGISSTRVGRVATARESLCSGVVGIQFSVLRVGGFRGLCTWGAAGWSGFGGGVVSGEQHHGHHLLVTRSGFGIHSVAD
jgi:hypothetical protein